MGTGYAMCVSRVPEAWLDFSSRIYFAGVGSMGCFRCLTTVSPFLLEQKVWVLNGKTAYRVDRNCFASVTDAVQISLMARVCKE